MLVANAYPMLISHVDLRVRDRARSEAFYDPIMTLLGAAISRARPSRPGRSSRAATGAGSGSPRTPNCAANPNRVALLAPSRAVVDAIFAKLAALGARNIEAPDEAYGPAYYACFFDDLDGNRLEVCAIG